MLNPKEIDLIERYFSGNANGIDCEMVERIFADGENRADLKTYLRNAWSISVNEPYEEVDLNPLLQSILKTAIKPRAIKKLTLLDLYSRVAAILLIPLVLTFLYVVFALRNGPEMLVDIPSEVIIEAPFGSRVSFVLPDGTSGFLNSGSSLTYQLPFSEQRNLELKGEASFEVVSDAENPFNVRAGSSEIRVLGTKFNLNAYTDEPYIEVVLVEGSLEFSPLPRAQPVAIQPGERLIFHDKKIVIEATDALKYTSWTQGKLVFRGDPMSEVARRISRWYHVDVVIADSELDQYSFRGTFEDDSLDEVMRLIRMTSPIHYQIVPRSRNADGTWNREKVIVSRRS